MGPERPPQKQGVGEHILPQPPTEAASLVSRRDCSPELQLCRKQPCAGEGEGRPQSACRIDFSVSENTARLSLLLSAVCFGSSSMAVKFIQGKLAFILGSLALG